MNQRGGRYTQVPLETETRYMAKYPCQGHSDDEHSHNQKEVVQQLLIKQDNGSYECYIINIIPYQECEISAADIASTFTISNGMQGFSGFVAYHQLNGEVVKVEGFDNGIKQKSMQYNPNDRNAIFTLTKNVKLYPDTYKQTLMDFSSHQLAYAATVLEKICLFCGKQNCTDYHNIKDYCIGCHKLYYKCECDPVYHNGQKLVKCSWCGMYKNDPVSGRACLCQDWRNVTLPRCNVCNALNCYYSHKNNCYDRLCLACGGPENCPLRLWSNGRHIAHADILRSYFLAILSFSDIHSLQEGCMDRFTENKEMSTPLLINFMMKMCKRTIRLLKIILQLKF